MIGERLAEIRKDHKDTQHTLAQKLHVAHHTVSSWEQGKSSPSNEMLVVICRLYQVSSDYLLGLSDSDPAYVQHRQQSTLTTKELSALKEYETFLLWKRNNSAE